MSVLKKEVGVRPARVLQEKLLVLESVRSVCRPVAYPKVAHLVAHPGQKKPLNPLQESAAFMYWLRGQDLNL